MARKRKPKKRNYAKEYARRLERGAKAGKSPEQARGHHKREQTKMRTGSKSFKIYKRAETKPELPYSTAQIGVETIYVGGLSKRLMLKYGNALIDSRASSVPPEHCLVRLVVQIPASAEYPRGLKTLGWYDPETAKAEMRDAMGVVKITTWTF